MNKHVLRIFAPRPLLWLAIATACMALPDIAFAAQGLGQIGQNLGSQANGIAYFLRMLAWVTGFGLLMGGILAFVFRHKTNTSTGVIMGLIFGGIALLSLMTLASSLSTSVFGYDATTSAQSVLGGN